MQGHVMEELKKLPDEIVQCVVTSPPYYGLRDYKLEGQIFSDSVPLCEEGKHEWYEHIQPAANGLINNDMQGETLSGNSATRKPKRTDFCVRCNAWRGQLGLEPTPEMYVRHLVEIFREVKRVIRKDGVMFVNMGDSYAGSGKAQGQKPEHTNLGKPQSEREYDVTTWTPVPNGLKPKDLMGMPWRVAFALQQDGWWLRSDIIWNKKNPMPESVTDRPTKAHEYIFLLTKSARYYYDADAVRERITGNAHEGRKDTSLSPRYEHEISPEFNNRGGSWKQIYLPTSRNQRSVWEITTEAYKGAHFATFPREIPEKCIKAGTSERGACGKCGSPWERITKPTKEYAAVLGRSYHDHQDDLEMGMKSVRGENRQNKMRDAGMEGKETQTLGWRPTCKCEADIVPCIVLDPFAGAGTTLEVAKRMGRDYVGIELSEKYVKELIEPRLSGVMPLFDDNSQQIKEIHSRLRN